MLGPVADGVVIDHGEGHKRGIASDHVDVQHWSKLFGKAMDDARREMAFFMELSKIPFSEFMFQKTEIQKRLQTIGV